ncbi:Glucan 1,3-beta-glucosidase 3 [Orbilia ellipsospora]|uniref:Glucan 1,3-beta-glucosidase 3 n=1 Tax=Orbilia ellipsospora TaxID=2528407 RepID=A0AAV9XIH7_9PEZI
MRNALKEITDAIKHRGNEAHHGPPPVPPRPGQNVLLASENEPLLAEPLERDVLAYRYHHGTNLGAIFVAEKWLFGTVFAPNAQGDSELDAVASQVTTYGVDAARKTFESFWSTTMTPQDWTFLASTANVTTVRLPIGYFSLGPKFCRSTPFEPYSAVYTNSWQYIKQFVTTAASYGIGTLIDLHALPGGANGDSHSGTSSHQAALWNNPQNLKLAVDCIKFIASETKDIPFVVGIQVVNEAIYNAPGMYQFYDSVITEVGKINSHANIYISDGWDLGTALKYSVGVNAVRGSCSVIVDTHKYYCFSDDDKKLNPWQIIDKVALSEVDGMQGQGATVIVGEYSCVMDGNSWGSIQGEQRKELATSFGQKEVHTWQQKSGGSFFWTYKMAWMPGGEWGFSEQTANGAVPAPTLAIAEKPDIESRLAKAQQSRDDLKRASLAQHVNYWNAAAPGQYFEHWRYQDGWENGFDDALIFFTYRLNHGSRRKGADRIGMSDLWTKKRETEYEALEEKEHGPSVNKAFFWEFGHGVRQGIKDFERVVGFS